jgi:hypothetical protein
MEFVLADQLCKNHGQDGLGLHDLIDRGTTRVSLRDSLFHCSPTQCEALRVAVEIPETTDHLGSLADKRVRSERAAKHGNELF